MDLFFALEEVPLLYPPQCKLCSIAFNGRHMLCGTDRGSVLLFELPTYALVKVVVLSGELEDVCRVGISPSGRFIAGCLAKSGITVIHNLDLDREIFRHDAHRGSVVTALVWSETGAFFVTGDRRGRCFRHTITPGFSLPVDVKLVLQCRTPIVQLALSGRMLLVSSHRGSMVLTLGTLKELVQGVQVGRQSRDGPNFGATFLPLSVSSSFRRHSRALAHTALSVGNSASSNSLTAFRPGSADFQSPSRRTSSCASESSLGLDLDGASGGDGRTTPARERLPSDGGPAPDAFRDRISSLDGEMMLPSGEQSTTPTKAPARHSSRVSLPLSPTIVTQPLVCCSRPKGRLWVAEPRTGTVLATLKPEHDPALAQASVPVLEASVEGCASAVPPVCPSPTSTGELHTSRLQYDCAPPEDFVPSQKLIPMCVRRCERNADGTLSLSTGDITLTTCLLSHGANGVSVLDIHPNSVVSKVNVRSLGHVLDCCTSEPGAVGSNTLFLLHTPSATHLEAVPEEEDTRSVSSAHMPRSRSQSQLSHTDSGVSDFEGAEKAADADAKVGAPLGEDHSAAFVARHGKGKIGHGYGVKASSKPGPHAAHPHSHHRRRRAKCHTQVHRVYPSCLSSRSGCDKPSCGKPKANSSALSTSASSGGCSCAPLPKSCQIHGRTPFTPVVSCLRVMSAGEFLLRMAGPSTASQIRVALLYNVKDVRVLKDLRAAYEELLATAAGHPDSPSAKTDDATTAPSRSSSRTSFVNVPAAASVNDSMSTISGRSEGEWVDVNKASPLPRVVLYPPPHDTPSPPHGTPALLLSKEDWERFVSYCDTVIPERLHMPHVSGFDSDDDSELMAGGPKSQATRASVLRSGDRLSGMFSSLRSALNAVKAERQKSPHIGAAAGPSFDSTMPSLPSPVRTVSGLVLGRGGSTSALGGLELEELLAAVDDAAVGTAVEAVPVHVRRSLLESLLVARSQAEALAVMSVHCQDLADLPLPLLSHDSVSESQAVKDANRDRLSLNGIVQPSGSAQATLDALVGLASDFVKDSDAAVTAAMNVLKSASRTATGGDSYFAVQALLKNVGIITPASLKAMRPVIITTTAEGNFAIESDNVFDIYSEHEFASSERAVATGANTLPSPWLRLSVTVKEEGSFGPSSRSRRLSITALPTQS